MYVGSLSSCIVQDQMADDPHSNTRNYRSGIRAPSFETRQSTTQKCHCHCRRGRRQVSCFRCLLRVPTRFEFLLLDGYAKYLSVTTTWRTNIGAGFNEPGALAIISESDTSGCVGYILIGIEISKRRIRR